jgi:hypothetical protein
MHAIYALNNPGNHFLDDGQQPENVGNIWFSQVKMLNIAITALQNFYIESRHVVSLIRNSHQQDHRQLHIQACK